MPLPRAQAFSQILQRRFWQDDKCPTNAREWGEGEAHLELNEP